MNIRKGQEFVRPDLDPIRRLLLGLQKDKNTDCWLWTGSKSGHYGQISIGNRAHWVHRVAYAVFFGGIEQDMDVHHRCHNTLCCNPQHLEQISRAENVAEMNVNKREVPGQTCFYREEDVPF